jgi:hypothetical protein
VRSVAGKRRSTRLRRGGKWLKTTLIQAAWAAVKVKGSYLQAQFHRIRARRGAKKAIVAVAASMLTAAWHMLRDGTEWQDLGAAHFDRADAARTANRLIRRLQQIGYVVHATPAWGTSEFHFSRDHPGYHDISRPELGFALALVERFGHEIQTLKVQFPTADIASS